MICKPKAPKKEDPQTCTCKCSCKNANRKPKVSCQQNWVYTQNDIDTIKNKLSQNYNNFDPNANDSVKKDTPNGLINPQAKSEYV